MSFNLPQELNELKAFPNWVAYRLEMVKGRDKPAKVPYNPNTGERASPSDPATWGTYAAAVSLATERARLQGLRLGQNHGVGFMFGNSPYAGIDMDNVIIEDGTLKPFAREVVDTMNSYTERSQSGRGLHILFRLDCPMSDWGNGGKRNDDIGFEMYDSVRYFAITGDVYGQAKPIEKRTEQARKFFNEYLLKPEGKNSKETPQISSREKFQYDLTDDKIMEKMFNSEKGYEIRALFSGDTSSYGGDWSRADLALCNYLAYWTNNDERQMDSLFRQSALYRPEKWDKKHYGTGETYGQHTIREAIRATPTYIATQKGGNPPTVDTQQRQQQEGVENPALEPSVFFINQYIDETLEKDLTYFQQFSKRRTGYYNIDENTTLYPGLYLLGGISSLGKTTFAHQMADQLARAGDSVLFFVLEQRAFEIVTKGLARLTAQENFQTAVSSLEIREGRITDSVRRAMAEYKNITNSKREAIIECNFNTNIDTIIGIVKKYIQETGRKPVVFIDYLQLIRPLDKKMIAKDAVDEHVRAFKLLQMEYDLVIFLISSLNRQNYLTTIDFEAFKETGGLEYTCDVMWGLQLNVMNNEIFDTDKKLMSKRELVKQAKRESPRKIELCVLKNRYGVANCTYHFDYYSKYDLFIPVEARDSDDSVPSLAYKSKRIKK